jgi:hypothetical protein
MEEEMLTAGGSAGIHALCDDVLVGILVRLPSKSVLRCRAVCRSWRRITTDRSFLADHAARRPLGMITLTSPSVRAPAVHSMSLSGGDGPPQSHLLYRQQLARDGTPMGDLFNVLYSLDGLLVLCQCRGLFIVCNPTTRQWTNLPAIAPEPCFTAIACGFYLHGSSGEYRLLCHGMGKEESRGTGSIRNGNSHYYVLNAGGTLPRRLGRAPQPTHSSGAAKYADVPVARQGGPPLARFAPRSHHHRRRRRRQDASVRHGF